MKPRNSLSRISLGDMKHRSRFHRNPYPARFVLSAILSDLILTSSSSIAAQTHAKPVKRRSRVGRVQTGLDVLEMAKLAPLRGKHIGLIPNHTGLDYQQRPTLNVPPHPPGGPPCRRVS